MFWLKTGASFGCYRLKPFYLEIYSPIARPLPQIIISSWGHCGRVAELYAYNPAHDDPVITLF